jgi:hypothetical protein
MTLPVQADADRHDGPRRKVTFTVDGERFTTREDRLTPNDILALAGLDPATHYLVEVKGRHQTSYEGRGDEKIRVHDGDVFVSVSTGPTPVS